MYVNFSIKNVKYLLGTSGNFYKFHYEKGNLTEILAFRDQANKYDISNEVIEIIIKFLEKLRTYWSENYCKRKIFKRKLKRKIDFKKLIE